MFDHRVKVTVRQFAHPPPAVTERLTITQQRTQNAPPSAYVTFGRTLCGSPEHCNARTRGGGGLCLNKFSSRLDPNTQSTLA